LDHIRHSTQNLLLQSMPDTTYERLASHFERIDLPAKHRLEEVHQPIDFVYFIESGLASVVAQTRDGLQIEVGLIGREGFTGASLLYDDDQTPFECYMQVPGEGVRIATPIFAAAVFQSHQLRRSLLRYARSATIQLAYTTLCNGKTHIDQRLARWLLMVHDRMLSSALPLTHEFLSVMLGVRRPSVTDALHVLEKHGLIGTSRSMITIKNREALILFAGSTYGPAEREYLRLTGQTLGQRSW